MNKKISILLPVYNEEGNIAPVATAIKEVFTQFSQYRYDLFFIDDGSTDNTLDAIKELGGRESNIFYLSFSRNFGKESALLAGLQNCDGDAVITMDADLQHPPELLPEFLRLWEAGNEVVYAIRREKNVHASFFSRLTHVSFTKRLICFLMLSLRMAFLILDC